VPAAGAPWFMALFGRDALITAYQTMMLGSEPAMNVLRALARYQATERDDFRTSSGSASSLFSGRYRTLPTTAPSMRPRSS
jgi:glycogen debranching enzyme